jgi:hypothetical protein
MTHRFRGWIATACALAFSALALSPAQAADDYTVKDSTGATITIKAKEVSSKKLTTHTVADSAGALIDPATSGKQDTGNASLGSIDTKLTGVALATNQVTTNASLSSIDGKATSTNTKLDTLHTDLGSPTPGGTNAIGDVGSASFSVTCSTLTLPGTGGTYASGDLVANSATAGSVVAITCANVARYSGGPVTITRASILKSATGVTNPNFYVHAYTAVPTVTNGNDGAFLSTASGHFCRLAVTADLAFSNGAEGVGVPISGSTCTRVLSATRDVTLLIEARAAYAWTAGETLIVTLEGLN